MKSRLPNNLQLFKGSHDQSSGKGCVMEWVSWMADEPWSDRPKCVCPIIGAFCRSLNDKLPDVERQKLKSLIKLVIDTKSTKEVEIKRMFLCVDFAFKQSKVESLQKFIPTSKENIKQAKNAAATAAAHAAAAAAAHAHAHAAAAHAAAHAADAASSADGIKFVKELCKVK